MNEYEINRAYNKSTNRIMPMDHNNVEYLASKASYRDESPGNNRGGNSPKRFSD